MRPDTSGDDTPKEHRSGYDPGLGRVGFARDLLLIRFRRLRIDQATFARRFGLSFGAVRDAEQGRVTPSRAARVLVAAIEMDPGLIERAARVAESRWPDTVRDRARTSAG